MKYLSTALALMMILFLSSCNENDESIFGSNDRNTESILNGKGQGNIVGKITSYLNTLNIDKDSKKTVMSLRNDFVDCLNTADDYCECVAGFYSAIKEANMNADAQAEIMAWLKEQYADCIPDENISPCEVIEAVANAYPNDWELKRIVNNYYNNYASGAEPCDCENLVYFLRQVSITFQFNITMFNKHSSGPVTTFPLSKEELLNMLSKTDCYEFAMSNSNHFKFLLDGVPNPYHEEVGAESADVEGEVDVEE